MIEIDQNEKVLRIVRKHWFVFFGDLFILLTAVVFPTIILFLFEFLPVKAFLNFSGSPLYVETFFLFAWLFVVWMFGWTLWTNYYLDVVIVTDKRVFTIEQVGLFKRISSSFRIDHIQNITVLQDGIIQTLLGFGTIRLETAGESEDFVGTWIANPYDLKKFLNELHDVALDRPQLVHVGESAPKTSEYVPISR